MTEAQETYEERLGVEAVRAAAEDRYAARIAGLEQELEAERVARATLIESSERRLRQIEEQAVQATERIAAAEEELAREAERLRAEAESAPATMREDKRTHTGGGVPAVAGHETLEAAVAWARGQVRAARREFERETGNELRKARREIAEARARAGAMERRVAELALQLEQAKAKLTT